MTDAERAQAILAALHGLSVLNAERMLTEASEAVRAQGNAVVIDQDYERNRELDVFGFMQAARSA